MCGIAGSVDLERPADGRSVAAMAAALRHRGPDADGFFETEPEQRPSAALGFRRLSIIDLSTGDQPLSNEDGSIWIVFNGEIYNFRELRRELESCGHRFATQTDTEVIVHLYEDLGARCVDRLNGMFAFAIWDQRHRKLVLARDRFGKKPLYYFTTQDGLVFASELNALLEHADCPREIDDIALGQYVALEYVPAPRTIIAGVAKLPRAHVLEWHDGTIALTRYWELPIGAEEPRRTDAEYVDEFRRLFTAAVERRLISDVPLGAFLSGGIDSSSIVAEMVDLMPPTAVKTFSIGFDEPSFDESEYAREVALHLGTDHRHHTFTVRDMIEIIPRVAVFLDEPLADASILPTHLLSCFAREHVTVALGGDGGDELLAGYPTYAADVVARHVPVPPAVRELLVRVADFLPVSTDNFSFDFKVKRFVRGLGYPVELRHAAWLGSFTPSEQARLLRAPHGDPFAPVRETASRAPSNSHLSHLIHFYVDGYLQNDILTKVDRASMACSLEVRAPFLDRDLVEFLARVPDHLKLHRSRSKVLLKRAAAGRLPPEVVSRKKKGFGIPIAKWLKDDLRELLTDELAPAKLARRGLFEPDAVQQLVSDHIAGRRDNRKQLWTLLSFELWCDAHLNRIARPRDDLRVA